MKYEVINIEAIKKAVELYQEVFKKHIKDYESEYIVEHNITGVEIKGTRGTISGELIIDIATICKKYGYSWYATERNRMPVISIFKCKDEE